MKKGFISLSIVLVLFFAGIYIFIPRQLNLSGIAYINCTPSAAYRFVSEEAAWAKWWPEYSSTGKSFVYNGYTYRRSKKMYSSLEVTILRGDEQEDSKIILLPFPSDSVVIQWQCSMVSGNNPFKKMARYKQATDIKKNMNGILGQLAAFLGKKENVYGLNIQRVSTTDTALIATKTILPAYPSTAELYKLVDTLKNYISIQGAQQTGYPIMNVTLQDDRRYRLMVAVPASRTLPEKGDLFPRKMVPGAFMAADVKGGDAAVREALQQMSLYFEDNRKMAMAIPFAALVTDRSKETDTSRWVTRIYAPVF